MTDSAKTQSGIGPFKVTVFAFACILGGLAIWILAAELLCPVPIEFTTNAQYAASVYEQRNSAIMAAQIGHVRGDLWADAALANGDALINEDYLSKTDADLIKRTRALTEQAIGYAPHDSRLWLLLALTYLRLDSLNSVSAASLRMSFYTGSNAIGLVPVRLFLATKSPALDDDEFRELVRHDIHIAVIHKSELMPAVVAAYNDAPLSGKQFIEKTLTEFDSSMLPLIRSEGQHR